MIIDPQLSHTYKNDDKIKIQGTWFISEKYDGIRALWNGSKLYTRSMREFTWVPEWFVDSLPTGINLDGELIVEGEPFSTFSTISIQKESPDTEALWKKIKYYIFDVPIQDMPFIQRHEVLKNYTSHFKLNCVEFEKIENSDKIYDFYKKIISRGGEGVMLIDSKSNYEFGKRVWTSLKYKKFLDGEATVVSYHEGKGKYKGFLGKIKCRMPDGKTFMCGTGFNDLERMSYIFSDDSVEVKEGVPKIGDTITYTCMELTSKTNIPRMSVFKCIRV